MNLSASCSIFQDGTSAKFLKNLQAIFQERESRSLNYELIENILFPMQFPVLPAMHELFEKWQKILVFIVVAKEFDCANQSPCKEIIADHMQALNQFSWLYSSQLLDAYALLAAKLIDGAQVGRSLVQLDNGMCPLQKSHFSLPSLAPYPVNHAELGLVYWLCAKIAGDIDYITSVEKLATWLMQATLDNQFRPLHGLFSYESEATKATVLANYYMLFCAMAETTGKELFACAAEQQLRELKQLQEIGLDIEVSLTALLVESHLSSLNSLDLYGPSSFCSESFRDDQIGVAILRSENSTVVASLCGYRSGLGCFYEKDVQILSYGPHHLPLGDCRNFGIETCKQDIPIKVSMKSDNFSLAGKVLMVSTPREDAGAFFYERGVHSGTWLDVKQVYQHSQLNIDVTFYSFADLATMAFVFFAKADTCLVGNSLLKPRSFKNYRGQTLPIHLQGTQAALNLSTAYVGEMQVIPLAGGNSFWGADFLIAYTLHNDSPYYSWILKLAP